MMKYSHDIGFPGWLIINFAFSGRHGHRASAISAFLLLQVVRSAPDGNFRYGLPLLGI